MPSAKTAVIEYLFKQRYDEATGTMTDDLITFNDVVAGIRATGADLRTNNPANFFKDLTRSAKEENWPASVLAAGWTGVDAVGAAEGACFRFVRLPEGQSTAFSVGLQPSTEALDKVVVVQSLSMPVATKELGREDENWVAQVASRLSVVETHFAISSPLDITEMTFLQTGAKMRKGEVDTAYSLAAAEGGHYLLSGEVKGRREQLPRDQILRAAVALAGSPAGQKAKGVIPFGMKVIGEGRLWCVEFEPVTATTDELSDPVAETIIELRPTVRGVG